MNKQPSSEHVVQPLLYSRQESARILSVCLRTLEHLISNGELETVRIGRRVLIHHKELELFSVRGTRNP